MKNMLPQCRLPVVYAGTAQVAQVVSPPLGYRWSARELDFLTILRLAIVAALVLVVGACGGSGNSEPNTEDRREGATQQRSPSEERDGADTVENEVRTPEPQSEEVSQSSPDEIFAAFIGDRVTVGSLELTVLSVEPYDAAQHNIFNDANTRVQVQVRKHKGEEYDFSIFSEFTIIDLAGVGYDADVFCTECPDDVFDLTLYGDTAVQRFVYFEVPDRVVPVSLRYEPGLFFTDAVFIALSPTTAAGMDSNRPRSPPPRPRQSRNRSQVIGDRVTVGSLELVDPAPGAVSTFGDGTFVVGADIRPGRYRAVDLGAFCSWSRLSGFSGEFDDIIAIEIPQGASALVDIRPTDVGFESSGCGTWSSDLAAVTAGSTAPFGDGTYLVGVDVAPGTWRAPGGEFCTWQRLAGFSGDFGELIAIDIVAGPAIVSIAATDIGFSTTGCGSWTRG